MSAQLVTVHGDGVVLLSLYCWQHDTAHTFTAEAVERLAYLGLRSNLTDIGRDWCPASAVERTFDKDYAEGVDEDVRRRVGSGDSIPERHRDGPDERLADLPDPCEPTFDPTVDKDS